MYAKFIDGEIIFAKRIEEIGGVQVKFPTEEQYRSIGFKPVRFTEMPEAPDGYRYEEGFREETDEIVQTWTMVELPDDVDEAEAFDIIFGGEV